MQAQEFGRTPVVVLRAEHYGTLGIVRSLGRLGVPVFVVDASKTAPAVASRYCAHHFQWDLEAASAPETTDFLRRIARRFGRRPILVPTTDETTAFVDDQAHILKDWFVFPARPPNLAQSLMNKEAMFHLANDFGIPTPETMFPKNLEDAERYAARATFPVLLKGIDGAKLERQTGKKMMIISRRQDLSKLYESMEDPDGPNLMMQDYIARNGDSIWVFNGYFNDRSECLMAFTGRKIRQNPAYTGMTSLGVVQYNRTIIQTSMRFMKSLGYSGLVDIDFCYDERDGIYKILDVNPRIGATFRLFVGKNGLDIVRAMYLDLTGRPVPNTLVREERKWIVEDKDVRSSVRYFKDKQLTLREWVRSLGGIEEAGYFATDDLWPFLVMCSSHFKKRITGGEPRRQAALEVSPVREVFEDATGIPG